MLLALDFAVLKTQGSHKVSIREALGWSGVWIAIALAFCGWMLLLDFYKIPVAVALGAVFAILIASIVASLLTSPRPASVTMRSANAAGEE